MSENRRIATLVSGTVIIQDAGAVPTASTTLTPNSATPSVLGGSYFITANTIATSYTDFINGVANQYFVLFINDLLTTITNSATISLPGGIDLTFSVGDMIAFKKVGTVWYGFVLRLA
jgi:hypothetical protein